MKDIDYYTEDWEILKYWDKSLIHQDIRKMRPYMLSLPKKFYEFKVIELKSPDKVVVHMTFLHPKFDLQQKIYFS